MSKTTKPNRTASAVVHFHITPDDEARLLERASKERSTEYGKSRTGVSTHEMSRRIVLEFLEGEVRLTPETRASVVELTGAGEDFGEALDRLLRVGIGRARTLLAAREKAS